MLLIKGLYTALEIVTFVNAITSLHFFWPREKKSTKSEPEKDVSVWTWKDTVWVILILISIILFIAIILFSFSKTRVLIAVVTISYILEQVSTSIISAEAVGNIVRGNSNKMLGIKDYAAIITLALLVIYLNIYGLLDKIVEYANRQTNTIFSDWILLLVYVASIAITTFFICSLALRPIQIAIKITKKLFSHFITRKSQLIFEKIKKQATDITPTNTWTASLIEHNIKIHSILVGFLWLGVPITIILDVFRILVMFLYKTAISIIWYVIYIIVSAGKIISQIAKWILLLSDRNVVMISFRIAVILGFGLTVIINQYEPFLFNQQSTTVFEFISSTIIIPVILEWILSYKSKMKNAA